MTRKNFNLNPPFREIRNVDALKEFKSEFLETHGIDFVNLPNENKDDKYVWVYDLDDKILAVLSFLDTSTHFFMDVVFNNDLWTELCNEVHPGFSLFSMLEDLSPNFDYHKILLDSTDDRLDYWKHHGYQHRGMPYSKPKWGKLYPMQKDLQ